MKNPANSDKRLLEFERIAMNHLDGLYNLAYHLTSRREDVEDIVQETYLRAYKYFHQFQTGTNFRAWMFRILRNLIHDHFRKTMMKTATVSLELVGPVAAETGEFRSLETEIALSADSVQKALNGLSSDFRMIVLLRYVEELPYREIAAIVGCPIGTVMSRLNRARKQMRMSFLEKSPESVSRERRSPWSDEKMGLELATVV